MIGESTDPTDDPSTSDPDRILLLVGDESNRELLAESLDDPAYSLVVGVPDESVPESFDLCLADVEGYKRGRSALARAKEAERPRHLPCLLVAPDASRGGSSTRAVGHGVLGRLEDGNELVDDVLFTPVREAELRRRVESLLQTRRLSLALGNREQQYRRLVELTPEAIFLLDEGSVVFANEAGEALLSRLCAPDDDFAGTSLLEYVAVEDRDCVEEFLTAVRDGDAPETFVPATLPSPDGDPVSVEMAGTRVAYGDGMATQLVVRDVTDRERREKRLHLYRRAMDEASIGLTIADADRDDEPLIYANRSFERITGYSVSEAIGRSCRFLQGEDTDPEAVSRMREAIDDERPARVTVRNYRKDGTPFWNEVEITPVRNADEEVTHYLGFQRDVTDRVKRDRELETLHRATRQFLSATTVEEICEVVVDAAEEALDLPAAAVFLSDGDRLVPMALSDESRALFDTVPTFESGNSIAWEVFETGEAEIVDDVAADDRAHNPDSRVGSELIVPLGGHGIFISGSVEADTFAESDAQFVRTLAMNAEAALDRTDREQELRRRKRELQRYETIVRAAGEPIYTLDTDGHFVDVNGAMEELTGYDRDHLIGEHVSLVMSEADIERSEAMIAELLGGDPTDASIEIGIERADGEVRRCLTNIALLPVDEELRGTVGVVRDITERHRRSQRLEVMDRVLRHNLRNEMNVVRGRADAIRDLIPEEGLEHVDEIVRSADALLSLSEGARRFHDAFHTDDAIGSVDVVAEVEGAVESFDTRFPNATIETTLPDTAPARAYDAIRIAIEELIENAIVHNDASEPWVGVSVETIDGGVEVAVFDDGPGIPPAERRTIEGELESALDHASGLGLWLVSWIVDSSGGDIACDVDDGGTTVRVVLRNS